MTDCIRDDSTECDCESCYVLDVQFWREQDGDYDGPDHDEDEANGCVLGNRCCCPHFYHGPDECFSAQDAERWERERRARLPPTGRQRTRRLWAKRGRR